MVCQEFYYGFLDELDEGLKTRITEALHNFKKSDADEITKLTELLLSEVEEKHGIESFMGHTICRQFVLALNKKENKEKAKELLNKKLERFGRDEFHTLITLATLMDKNGEYEEAIQILQRANKVSDDILKRALVTIKLAADCWNFESKSVQAYQYQEEAMNLLRSLQSQYSTITSPTSENGMIFVHVYKTAAYLYRIQEDSRQSIGCYEKALHIINKSPLSQLQNLKTLSQLCFLKARMFKRQPYLVTPQIVEAISFVDDLEEDDIFMNAHPDSVCHVLSRLAHCYTLLNDQNNALKLRLRAFNILKTYNREDHPEVARMAADVALNYHLIKERDHRDEYIEYTEEFLENFGYKEDIVKAKLYFRELSDALRNLGNLFSLMTEYGDAERQYLLSVDLHKKVYGENHQRIAKVYRYLGNLYYRWEKLDQADIWYNKALDVQNLYLPAGQEFSDKIRKDLIRLRNPKSYRGRGPRGRMAF